MLCYQCLIFTDQSDMQEDWFAVFKFKVTVRAHIIRYDCLSVSTISTELLIFFATKFNWMVHHGVFCVKKIDCFQGQGHSKGSELYQIFMYLISSVPLSWQPN